VLSSLHNSVVLKTKAHLGPNLGLGNTSMNVQINEVHIQQRPLLSLIQNVKNWKMKTFSFSRDLEIGRQYIMCWG
jgi:hypothetical protein